MKRLIFLAVSFAVIQLMLNCARPLESDEDVNRIITDTIETTDTLVIIDTVEIRDTAGVDTIFIVDTIIMFDTTIIVDTVFDFLDPVGCESGKPRVLTMKYTGQDCSATSHNQNSGKVECSGDLGGASPVIIIATNKQDPNDLSGRIWFDGQVTLDASFDIDAGNAGQAKLSSSTFVHIYDLQNNLLQSVTFHTSCSQPLVVGNQFGSLLLERFIAD